LSFKDYIKQVLLNTKTMADYFQNSGYNVVSKGTDTHLFCLDISSLNTTGKFIEEELDKMNITCNKNAIPFDTKNRIQTSGIRLGTAAVTSRGLRETEIIFLSQLINQILQDIKNNTLTEKNKKEYKEEVIALCSKYPIY
jgi:glycine hydroxymethyltransferase